MTPLCRLLGTRLASCPLRAYGLRSPGAIALALRSAPFGDSPARRPEPDGDLLAAWRMDNTHVGASSAAGRQPARPGDGLDFTITTVNPLDCAADIKQLFVTHGRSDFPAFFDRAYPTAVRTGAMSWVARDRAGQVVMHVGCFPQRFRFGEREVVGGLLVNALVAQAYRSFFPAQALMRRAQQESKARGDLDFLYTDPNEPARAVLEVCGFVKVGTIGRYVLPVGDRRRLVDRAIRFLHIGVRVVKGTPSDTVLVAHPAAEFLATGFEAPSGDSPRLRPYYTNDRYAARMAGYPSASDRWFTFHRNGDASSTAAGLLVRGPDPSGVATLYAVRREPQQLLAGLIPGLITALRRMGCTRLQISTLAESGFGRELRAAGFVRRRDATPLIAAGLTRVGEAVVRSVLLWEITDLDCDR